MQLPIPVGTSPTDAQLSKLAEDLGFSGSTAEEVCAGPAPVLSTRSATLRHIRSLWFSPTYPMPCQLVPSMLSDCWAFEQAKNCFGNLYRMFVATDATQIEVNPLAETPDGKGTYMEER